MPQMMPINWMISFLFFICLFIIFNIMNYYIYNYSKLNFSNNFKNKKTNLTWKW